MLATIISVPQMTVPTYTSGNINILNILRCQGHVIWFKNYVTWKSLIAWKYSIRMSYNGNFSSTKLFYSQVCEANDKPTAGVFVYLRSPSVHCLLKPKHCLNGGIRAHEWPLIKLYKTIMIRHVRWMHVILACPLTY